MLNTALKKKLKLDDSRFFPVSDQSEPGLNRSWKQGPAYPEGSNVELDAANPSIKHIQSSANSDGPVSYEGVKSDFNPKSD